MLVYSAQTMPIYRLKYFNLRRRAELARLVLAEAGCSYEDFRGKFEDWPKIKPSQCVYTMHHVGLKLIFMEDVMFHKINFQMCCI